MAPGKIEKEVDGVVFFSVLSSNISATDPQSFIYGDSPEFRELTKSGESSAWAWWSAAAAFAADLLRGREAEDPVIVELANIPLASENAIFPLFWWKYEMQLYWKRDFLKHTEGAHKERVGDFRELAKEMVDERRDRIHHTIPGDTKARDMLKHRIRKTLTLCEGFVEGMEYYS